MRNCACMHMSISLPCDVVNRRAIRADFRARKWPGSTFGRGAAQRISSERLRLGVANAPRTRLHGRHGRAQPSNLRSRAPKACDGSRPTCRFRIFQHAEQIQSNLLVENRPTCGFETVQLAYSKRSNLQDPWSQPRSHPGKTHQLRRLLPLHAPDAKNGREGPRRRLNQGLIGRPR
jgi:hypothetical protein